MLAQLEQNGRLDAGFLLNTFSPSWIVFAAALQSDGSVVVAGFNQLARYFANGVPDYEGFGGSGGSGIAQIGPAGSDIRFNSVAIQADGRIVAAGSTVVAATNRIVVARLTPAGDLDVTFGTGGLTITPVGSWATGYATVVQPDGRILVAGGATTTEDDFAMARYWGL